MLIWRCFKWGYELDTFVWFRDHFDLVRDRQPNTPGHVHIDFIERQEIYILSVNEVQWNCLTFSSWIKFWKWVFPHVQIRQCKNVSGKCSDCALINNGRLVAQSQEVAKAFRRLHLLLKAGNFMLERLAYHDRRDKSRTDKTILSLIIDTLDNNHCSVPYLGATFTMSNPIHQGILGCFNHDVHDFIIYRTIGIHIELLKYKLHSLKWSHFQFLYYTIDQA